MAIVAVVLAGGLSRRMGGGDKPLLELAGKPIFAHVLERLRMQATAIAINANGDLTRFQTHGIPVLADITPGFPGPLGGVQAGLAWAKSIGASTLLTVAGDTPFFPMDLARKLEDAADVGRVVIATSDGRFHPTFGLWPLSIKDDLDGFLAAGGRKVLAFVERHAHTGVAFAPTQLPGGPADPFFNINTPADLAEAHRLMDSSKA